MQFLALLAPLILQQSAGKLQIVDVKVGKGTAVKTGDYVTVDYTGKLTNGKMFDTSVGKKPFKFIVGAGQVIKGWDQGLVGMKIGGKRNLTIPSSLGYGPQGAGSDIPPNATLKFEIQLHAIQQVKITILKKGSGIHAGAGASISLHYKGMLANGKKFDSSYDRNEPFPVTIGRSALVSGFTMGLIGIQKGEKRRVEIPADLGYGSRGAGGVIPPNADLIFEIEALEVNP